MTTIHEEIHYCPETGIVTRIKSTKSQRVGKTIKLNFTFKKIRKELTHWIWFYMTGQFPKGVVDHIDGNKRNNAWDNLRDVTQAVNLSNKHMAQKNNTSGYLGVSAHQGKYKARIKVNGKQIVLWPFDTPEEAHHAYLNERAKHHPTKGIK